MATPALGRRTHRPDASLGRGGVRSRSFGGLSGRILGRASAAAAVLALVAGGCAGEPSPGAQPIVPPDPAAAAGSAESTLSAGSSGGASPATSSAAPAPAATSRTTATTAGTAATTTTSSEAEPAAPPETETSTDARTATAPPESPEPPEPVEPTGTDDAAAQQAGGAGDGAAAPATPDAPRPEASTLDGLLALGRPLVIAHAGGDQDHPHSTLYAYTQAVAAGADVLELDVQLTADGVLIVQHDDTVDRTTEATGRVADLTLAEIQALDNAHWFVPGLWGDRSRPAAEYVFRGVRGGIVEPPAGFGPEDFRVATFREVAERFPHHVLDVEIKLQRGPDGEEAPRSGITAAEVLAAEIAELGREDSVVVACFNDDVLAAFRELAPDVATTPATDELVAWWLEGRELDPRYRVLQVPFTYAGIEVVQPDLVERLHSEGLYVWVWLSGIDVVETREFYADLLGRGVDGVIAGRPAEAVAALAEAP